MTRIDRYLFLAAFAPFAAAVFAFLVLFIGTEALSEASKLIARFGLPWQRVMLLLLLRIPWGIAWTLPMATGMAVILAIGRICHDYEYTAIIVGGASFKRVMVPFLVFAGMVTAFALYVQECTSGRPRRWSTCSARTTSSWRPGPTSWITSCGSATWTIPSGWCWRPNGSIPSTRSCIRSR